jgi:hypothetical protein
MRRFLTGLGVAAAFAVCGLAAPAAAQNTFRSGNWTGGPYFNGQQFSYCAVTVSYTDGMQLYIQLTAQLTMSLGASKSSWNMDPTKQYDVSIEVGAGGYKKSFRGRVTADRRSAIWFTIGNDPDLRRAIVAGGTMTWVDSQGARFLFNLTGGDNAMRKLLACAALYGAD